MEINNNTTLTKISFVILITTIIVLLAIYVVLKLKDPEFYYRNFICRSSQDSKTTKLVSKIKKEIGFYKDEKNNCFIYPSFFSNHRLTSDDEIQLNNDQIRCDKKIKSNAQKKALVKFYGFKAGYTPQSVTNNYGSNYFDNTLRVIYPSRCKNKDELIKASAEPILKLLKIGYKPENISILGISFGGAVSTEVLDYINKNHQDLLNGQKFALYVNLNSFSDNMELNPYKWIKNHVCKSIEKFHLEPSKKIFDLPVTDTAIIYTEQDELIPQNCSMTSGLVKSLDSRKNESEKPTLFVYTINPKEIDDNDCVRGGDIGYNHSLRPNFLTNLFEDVNNTKQKLKIRGVTKCETNTETDIKNLKNLFDPNTNISDTNSKNRNESQYLKSHYPT